VINIRGLSCKIFGVNSIVREIFAEYFFRIARN